jgi:DNA-directed RNA polymerase subunit N (RpoN/RPB10)
MKIKTTPPPRCYSCHTPLSHLYEIYIKEYRKRVEESMIKKGILVGDLSSVTDTDVLMGDFLDSLGIKRVCCRVRLMSHKNI